MRKTAIRTNSAMLDKACSHLDILINAYKEELGPAKNTLLTYLRCIQDQMKESMAKVEEVPNHMNRQTIGFYDPSKVSAAEALITVGSYHRGAPGQLIPIKVRSEREGPLTFEEAFHNIFEPTPPGKGGEGESG